MAARGIALLLALVSSPGSSRDGLGYLVFGTMTVDGRAIDEGSAEFVPPINSSSRWRIQCTVNGRNFFVPLTPELVSQLRGLADNRPWSVPSGGDGVRYAAVSSGILDIAVRSRGLASPRIETIGGRFVRRDIDGTQEPLRAEVARYEASGGGYRLPLERFTTGRDLAPWNQSYVVRLPGDAEPKPVFVWKQEGTRVFVSEYPGLLRAADGARAEVFVVSADMMGTSPRLSELLRENGNASPETALREVVAARPGAFLPAAGSFGSHLTPALVSIPAGPEALPQRLAAAVRAIPPPGDGAFLECPRATAGFAPGAN